MFTLQDGRESFYQWDLNRRLIIEDDSITEVHFCNKTDTCSLVVEVYEENGIYYADVPNILLQTDWRINVYAFDNEYTKHCKVFNVNSRTKPADYVYTETEIKTWEGLEAELSEKIDVAVAEGVEEIKEVTNIFANALKGKKTGGAITASGVSPIEHELKVKAESKNLFDVSKVLTYKSAALGSRYVENNGDGSITVSTGSQTSMYGSAPYTLRDYAPNLKVGETYILSADSDGEDNWIWLTEANCSWYFSGDKFRKKTITEEMLNSRVNWYASGIGTTATISNIQIEKGSVATGYAPYIEDFSTTNVIKYGGNLLDIESREVVSFGANSNTSKRSFTGNGIILGFSYNNYYMKAYHNSFEKHKNGFSYSCKENFNPYGVGFDFKASPNTTYVAYFDGITNSSAYISEYDKDGNFLRGIYSSGWEGSARKLVTTEENTAWIVVSFQNQPSALAEVVDYNNVYIGIENFTEFEEYKEPTIHPISADGTVEGVTSIYPTTTLTSDTEGVVLDVEYNRDINKAFEELTQAVISLGGNI